MARYEHLPICKKAMNLMIPVAKIARIVTRYCDDFVLLSSDPEQLRLLPKR